MTTRQRAALRAMCNTMEPVLHIGKDGIMLKNTTFFHNDKRYGVDENGKLLRNTTKTFNSGYPLYLATTYRFDSNGVATIVNPW